MTTTTAVERAGVAKVQRRAALVRTLLQWHWISSAISLAGLLLFAVTGFTLNHAGRIEASPSIVNHKAHVPPELLAVLQRAARQGEHAAPPAAIRGWALTALGATVPADATPEWSDDELYVAMPRPGGDAWLRIGLNDGTAEYEQTDRGLVAYLNDMHKGRHTGAAWRWFIDLFAGACGVFALTGLLLLQMHARRRPSTWPLVGLGVALPWLLALLFIH